MVNAKALLSVASCNADDNQTERNNDEEEKEHKVYTEAQLTRPDAAIAEDEQPGLDNRFGVCFQPRMSSDVARDSPRCCLPCAQGRDC